ncbi:hypothetical protein RhoFasK5_02154|nr:hypothetical protein [Rhodococcus kroppenstedtii]
MRPSADSKASSVDVTLRRTSYFLSVVGRKAVRNAGTAVDNSAPVAVPAARSATSTSASTPASQASASSITGSVGLVDSSLTNRVRRVRATPALDPACTTGMNGFSTTNRVRRMARTRTSVRASYMAVAMSASVAVRDRAITCSETLAGSVAWSARTRAVTASGVSDSPVPTACREIKRARRWVSVIRTRTVSCT